MTRDHDGELTAAFGHAWVRGFEDAVLAHAAELGDADRRTGDGDFADNVRAALRRGRDAIDAADPGSTAEVVTLLSEGFLGTGGTSGPLFGMWFREIGRGLDVPVDAPPDPVRALATGLRSGLATVQRLGGARIGDKTMVDALAPAADALDPPPDGTLAEAADLAAQAAERGAAATAGLRARMGRASYVGDHAVGVDDPGARTVVLFLRAGADAARGRR